MLPKINRIKNKKDFEAIFKNSASFKNNIFIFKIAKNGLAETRFGFVISQKVSKKATVRNKIKRILSEIIKIEFKNIKSGLDIVLIALSGIEKKEFSYIQENFLSLMSRAKIIKKL